MQIIPVLDLAGGIAVHAQAGERTRYAPLKSGLVPERVGDAVALLRAFHAMLDVHECYVADLDAIQGGAIQRSLIRELADFHTGFSGGLMVDAGTSLPGGALEVLSCGASQVVVGLETLHAFADLGTMVREVGPTRIVFSLDLRLGTPVLHPAMQDARGVGPDVLNLADQAAAEGVMTMLLLDLGRIGTGCGVDLGLLETLRRRFPRLRLLAGGGILTRLDLERMRDTGCDGALIASAIHTGRVTAADLAALGQSAYRPDQSGTSATW
ncbi:MAG: phosphoribosylformimino-5-aminoimidazole carboxamide ribotide isomerase [Gemmatimonadales bacterium]|jgi:phosphoribosylformimino-5-aminoimidazole carboxamide ribotide isomerase|nr:phosphoribosylformimino-5-aminoimidazole carboxamide ribotide isomerase [Gemmatimonadales bacterium]